MRQHNVEQRRPAAEKDVRAAPHPQPAVFAAVFLGERLSLPNWLGVMLIGLGSILAAYKA